MKIVALGLRAFPGTQGGVETHCEHLYTHMAERGHEIIVLCRSPYVSNTAKMYRGVRMVSLSSPKSKVLEAFLHTLVGIFYALRLRPDVLHIHAIGPSLMVPIARLLGMRVVTTNHGADYDRQKWGRFAKAVLRFGERMGSLYSHRVIAISQPIAEHLQSSYGCIAAVIPNGVVVRHAAIGTTTLAQFGLIEKKYLVAVGRLVPEKGFHDLIEAFAKVDLQGWKLVIVGRADHEDEYSVRLKRRAAEIPGVVMPGFMSGEPLHELYSHAGAVILPSYHEGLPIVMLEALSYGVPVLASDISGNRQAGLPADCFFPAGDEARMIDRIESIGLHDDLPEEKARRIEYVRRTFDWDLITARTLDLYRTVAKRRDDVPTERPIRQ